MKRMITTSSNVNGHEKYHVDFGALDFPRAEKMKYWKVSKVLFPNAVNIP
jgi:hypothetical protein